MLGHAISEHEPRDVCCALPFRFLVSVSVRSRVDFAVIRCEFLLMSRMDNFGNAMV